MLSVSTQIAGPTSQAQAAWELEKLSKLTFILSNWQGTVLERKNAERRARRSLRKKCTVRFVEMDGGSERMPVCEFDPDEAPRQISEPTFLSQDHNDIPWYEQEHEELPWWEYPDLDEDDPVTALCRKIMSAGDRELEDKEVEIRIARIEATVTKAALKLLNKRLYRKQLSMDSTIGK